MTNHLTELEEGGLAELRGLRGLVAITCTTGLVTGDTHMCFSNMRDWCSRNGFFNVEWKLEHAVLVEPARDAVAAHALSQGYDYFLMIDGDAAPFPNYALGRMLQVAFIMRPEVDVLGAYCQVKTFPHLPTIDTGTGTWQVEHPMQGLLQVIRTGGHFLLVKPRILRRFGPPWFRTRSAATSLDVLKGFDNLCRTQLDGQNPLAGTPAWDTLVEKSSGPRGGPTSVGEDSGFCDNVTAAGGVIAVDTDLVVGHVSTKNIGPLDLKDAFQKQTVDQFAACGVLNYH